MKLTIVWTSKEHILSPLKNKNKILKKKFNGGKFEIVYVYVINFFLGCSVLYYYMI
jgi:hypothetical protein